MNVVKVANFLTELGEAKFRLRQVMENYYSAKFFSFDEMTNISKNLRRQLSNNFSFLSVEEVETFKFNNSFKTKLKLVDKLVIETVLLKYKDWNTVCVSTQVGCAMGCLFCATGSMGFSRNLSCEEMIDQIIYWKQKNFKIDRIVFMGMGEPFLNWSNVKLAIETIHDQMSIGWRKMTVSTVGVVEGIKEFTDWGKEVNLAISLHSLNQSVRQSIMPSGKKYNIEEILESCQNYVNKSKRLLFFEYCLMSGINDSDIDAQKLSKLINSHKLYFLNLINLNRVKTSKIKPSQRVNYFCKRLDQESVKYSLRRSVGDEIKGACGQLVS